MNKKLILGIGSIVLGILLFIIFNTNIFNENEDYRLKLRINGDEIKGDKVILNSGNSNMFPINLILSKLELNVLIKKSVFLVSILD